MLKNKHKFLINGTGGVGKDSLIDIIAKQYQVMNISTVDMSKKAAEYGGWYGGKTEKDRKFLSDITMLFYKYNDTPYKYVKKNLENFNRWLYFQFMFVHCREIANIERLKRDFGFKTLLVKNPNVPAITSNIGDADASRDDYEYDYTIVNDGTVEDLEEKVKDFLEGLENV